MKKSIIVLVGILVLTLGVTSCKQNRNDHIGVTEEKQDSKLPESMYSFIMSVFPKATVKESKELAQTNYYGSTYSANLDNNMKLDFDRQGNWTEIEMLDNSAIPVEFLQREIPSVYTYVQANYPGVSILEVDRDSKKGYEISLSDSKELVFNYKQEFVGLDLDLDKDEEAVQESEIPQKGQAFISEHFGDATVVLVKKTEDRKGNEYKVYLSNGYKIEFDSLGEWKEIKGSQQNELPSSVFIEKITSYIKANYIAYKPISIERDRGNFQIEIEQGANDLELLFDANGNFLGIDD